VRRRHLHGHCDIWAQASRKRPVRPDARRLRPIHLTIQHLLFVPAEKGIPATAMRDYFQHSGFNAYAFSRPVDDLHHQCLARAPAGRQPEGQRPAIGPLH